MSSIAIAAVLFALAVFARCISWPLVFRPAGVLPFGNDAFYHLRRIGFTAANFPANLASDPLLNFPHGGQAIWPATLDWTIGGIARLLFGPDAPEAAASLAAVLPPIAGGVAVVLVFRVATRLFEVRVGVLAALLLALMPGHYYYSQLGFVDHHAFIAPLAWCAFAATLRFFEPAPRRLAIAALGWGLWVAACMLVWPGTLIYIALLGGALLVRLLTVEDSDLAVRLAAAGALGHAVAASVVAPFSLGNEWAVWGDFSAVVLSNFQPTYFAAGALAFAVLTGVWTRGWLRSTLGQRALAALLTGVLLQLALIATTDLSSVWGDAWGWLGKSEGFQANVNESKPLFAGWALETRARATGFLTHFIWVAPICFVWLGWRNRAQPARLFFVAWGLALLGLTILQWRFMNSYALPHAVLFSVVIIMVWDRVRLATAGHGWIAIVCAAIGGIALLTPMLDVYRPRLLTWSREGEQVPMPVKHRDSLLAAARWLGAHASARPGAEGVMGAWGDGHLIKYGSALGVVQDNFGDDVAPENFELAERYFASSDETAAADLLGHLGVRYVWARSTGAGRTTSFDPKDMRIRLWRLDGSLARAGPGRRIVVPALERHRMIYEASQWQRVSGVRRPLLLLYELVEGARVRGKAVPGEMVRFELELVSNNGRTFVYQVEAEADAAGRYSLRLPYPTGRASGAIVAGDRYRISSGDRSATLHIDLRDVEEGREVPAPALRDTPGQSAEFPPERWPLETKPGSVDTQRPQFEATAERVD